MKASPLFITVCLLLTGCTSGEYVVEKTDNPPYKPNIEFQGFEDLANPGFQHLIDKYKLDTIFHGETDEFRRILLLRHWIKSVIPINDHGDPYPGDGYVEGILDAALLGQGFHCGHFMKVQNGIMNAYGYVTRTLGAGPGVQGGPDGHHGINEIWLNDYNKWFLSDAKYDHHFEKNGVPLSALEIRDEYLKNKAADIIKVKGPDRIPTDIDPETGTSKERSAQTYTWIEFHTHNDMFTAWPDFQTMLTMYEDDYFDNHTWFWGGNPHWAYNQPEFMRLVKDRDVIKWTPNTIASKVVTEGNVATIKLISDTPNLATYQMKEMPGGDWKDVEASLEIALKNKRNEFVFRTLNLAGVTGPEHTIIINKLPKKSSKNQLTDIYIANNRVAKEAVLRSIPEAYINKARETLHIAYQHTSHGTQVARGIFGLPDYKEGDDHLFGITNNAPEAGKLDFHDYALQDYAVPGVDASDLSRNETAFIQATRNYLDDDANDDINVVMWSWCNIAGHQPAKNYLPGMDSLISEYGEGGTKIGNGEGLRPHPVTFIYMTGHANLENNTGEGNPKNQADLIVENCQKNKRYCLDYYSIDTHDMNDNYWEDAGDDGNSATYGGNFYLDWQIAHESGKAWYENRKSPGGEVVFGAHNSQHITANRKAYAMWWILARIAGWDGK